MCRRYAKHYVFLGLLGLMLLACQPMLEPSRQVFDQAEDAYRSGQYDKAHQKYAQFLKQNPDPQLARLAERRILSIEREIESVLGKKSGPRPVFVNREDKVSETPAAHPHIFN